MPSLRTRIRPHIQAELRAALGQLLRLALATPGSALGRVPVGNTGGSDVSLFQPMPVPADLQALIYSARHASQSSPCTSFSSTDQRNMT